MSPEIIGALMIGAMLFAIFVGFLAYYWILVYHLSALQLNLLARLLG